MSGAQTIASLSEERDLLEVRLQDIATFLYRPTTTTSQISAYTTQYSALDAQLCKVNSLIRNLQKVK